jgi:hypothetical protein
MHSKDAKSPKQHSGQRSPSPNRTAQGTCDNEDPSVFTLREFRAFADAFLGKVSIKKTQVGALLGFRCMSMSSKKTHFTWSDLTEGRTACSKRTRYKINNGPID